MGQYQEAVLDRLYDAFNRRDLDAILELCTEDSACDLGEVMPDQKPLPRARRDTPVLRRDLADRRVYPGSGALAAVGLPPR